MIQAPDYTATAQSLAAARSMLEGRTEQAQQAQQGPYYLMVIDYADESRLYVIRRGGDGTSCVVDTGDECVAQVTALPAAFDPDELPDDVEPTIPAGRSAPPTVSPSPGGDDPPADPTEVTGAASNPQPRDGATGVKGWKFSRETVGGPLLTWAATPLDRRYFVYLGTTEDLAANDVQGPFEAWDNFLQFSASSSCRTAPEPCSPITPPADLAHGTRYYWRVDTEKFAGLRTGSISGVVTGNVWSFITANAPPAATGAGTLPGLPANPEPRDGAYGVTRNGPILSWDATPRALSYDVYWGEGWVTAITVTDGGSGYTSAPEVSIGDGGGIRATATATVAGGAVTAVTLTNRGSGYAYEPDVWFRGGGGSGATAAATLGFDQGTPINTTSTSVRIATSSPLHSRTYFWRVDAKNEAGVTRGNVWSFNAYEEPSHIAEERDPFRKVVLGWFDVAPMKEGHGGVANFGFYAGGVGYRMGQVYFERHRLVIEVTPIASAEKIGSYRVLVGARELLRWDPESETFAFSAARHTPGDASNPDVYEWSSVAPLLPISTPNGDRQTLSIYRPRN